MPGILHLIPVPIAEHVQQSGSPEILSITRRLQYYVVENARTARRILRAWHPHLILESIQISEIDKHNGPDLRQLRQWLQEGREIGVMSEAGCPAIADPGSELVAEAHKLGAKVRPLTGPNSMILALMASGLGGQSFAFWGYLPVKDPARSNRIKALEVQSKKESQTQMFIETPYRNGALLSDFMKHCAGSTRICIAMHLTAENEWVQTKTVAEWRAAPPTLEKEPAVFLMLA